MTTTAPPPIRAEDERTPTRRLPASAVLRALRSMRTALWLLLAVAAAALVAVVIPQETTNAATVAHWRAGVAGPGPVTTSLLDAAGVFDVFGAWWFTGLTALLLASLVTCLVPRHRALARSWRRPPPEGRRLASLHHSQRLTTALPAAEAAMATAAVLRRRRYRVRVLALDGGQTTQVAAERGRRAREAGSLAFHTAIVAMLGAVALGHLWGFTGQVDLVEGETFTDARLAYDRWSAGPAFGIEDHRGTATTLAAFRTSTHPNGTPKEFVATVEVEGTRADVEVNHPLVRDGTRLHLARYGLAPRLIVRDAATAEVLHDAPVKLATAGPLAWRGMTTVGVPDAAGNQLALDLVLLPDAAVGADGRPVALGTGAVGSPVLLVDAVLGPDVVRDDGPARSVDRTAGTLGASAVVQPGAAVPAGDGRITVEFSDPVFWAGFQVTRTPGLRLLLASALVMLIGLTVSLRAYPRRVWVEARATGSGSELLVAGVARDREDHFTGELSRLLGDLRRL